MLSFSVYLLTFALNMYSYSIRTLACEMSTSAGKSLLFPTNNLTASGQPLDEVETQNSNIISKVHNRLLKIFAATTISCLRVNTSTL